MNKTIFLSLLFILMKLSKPPATSVIWKLLNYYWNINRCNRNDPNAIDVINKSERRVGWVPREAAVEMVPLMYKGLLYNTEIISVTLFSLNIFIMAKD